MSFLRQLWEQKPEAWGPVSEVQSSLFKRAERIGIDSQDIALAMPMWGPGGQVDYANHILGTNNNVTFQKNSLNFLTTNSAYIDMGPDINMGIDSITTVLHIKSPVSQSKKGLVAKAQARAVTGRWGTVVDNYMITAVAQGSSGTVATPAINAITAGLISSSYKLQTTVYDRNGNLAVWVDNKKITSASMLPVAGNNIVSSFPLVLGAFDTTYSAEYRAYLTGDIDFFLFIRRALKDSQIASLSDNPYQLWQRVAPVSYFIPGLSPSGLTFSQQFSWKIRTVKESDVAWNVLTQATQNTAWQLLTQSKIDASWHVVTELTENSAWKILNSEDQDTSWKILKVDTQESAWKVKTQANQEAAWRVKTQTNQDSAWKIFSKIDQDTAWKILTSASGLSQDISWRILTSEGAVTGWQIKSAANTETAWKIATGDSQDISWSIKTQAEQETVWKILTGTYLEQEVAWKILRVDNEDLAWHIKTQAEQDAAWKIYTKSEQATGWGILTDDIPDAVFEFTKQARTFIFNKQARTFIFNKQARTFIFNKQARTFIFFR